jgi:alginate O-acetyltransferase complex protein AlgJ
MSLRDRPLSLPDMALPRQRIRAFGLSPKFVPGIAMLVILVVGLLSSIYAIAARSELMPNVTGWAPVLRGEATSAISQFLQKQNPFGNTLAATDRVINWMVLGDLGPRVRQGCANWLFLADELELRRNREQDFAKRIVIVERVSAFLAQRHIGLVVVPVPDKTRVEAQHLCGLDRPPALHDRLANFEARLRGAGIRVVDILQPLAALEGERYYRTDTHWNEPGAKRVAQAIASSFRQWGIAAAPQAEFRVKTEPGKERVGDLIRLAGLDQVPLPLRPEGDVEAPATIEQSAKAGVGILDDVAAPDTVLLGTSYSRRANFANFLSLSLGAPVDNLAKDGGELTNSAIAYFANPRFTEAPPHTIVWEIPERFFDTPVSAADESWADNLAAPAERK